MFKNFKRIKHNGNGWVAAFIIYLLFLEVSKQWKIFKFLRLFIWQPTLGLCLFPSSFNEESLLTLRIVHPFMIIINGNSRVGRNCCIYHDVTIGAKELEDNKTPQIGDNVFIGCKSSLLGDIYIGNHTIVGAHSLVLKSPPPIFCHNWLI